MEIISGRLNIMVIPGAEAAHPPPAAFHDMPDVSFQAIGADQAFAAGITGLRQIADDHRAIIIMTDHIVADVSFRRVLLQKIRRSMPLACGAKKLIGQPIIQRQAGAD